MSAHIKAMEESLGLSLFERTPRGMVLTADGARLLVKVEETLRVHREFLEEAGRMKGRLTGRIRLGAARSTNAAILGRFLSLLSSRHPEVEVELHHGGSAEVLGGIRRGTVDAGIYVEAGTPDADLATIEVDRFAVYLAAPPGTVATGEPVEISALAERPWICPNSNTCCGKIAESLFETHGFRPKKTVSVEQERVTRTLIAGGVGLGLLHAPSAMEARDCGEADLICEVCDGVSVVFAHLIGRSNDPVVSAADAIMRDLAG
ncbi:DNA-binding transcriptional LysR family regulator [Rhodobium orientis]|nr:DNA-binding transcriptional LysR family regulator [Rhodobium orientis]